MKSITNLFLFIIFGLVDLARGFAGHVLCAANAVVPGTVLTHPGKATRKCEAAVTAEHLLLKQGTDDDEVDICGASDIPLFHSLDTGAIGELIAVGLLGNAPETAVLTASGDIVAGEAVYTAAGGKIQDLPTSAATYYRVGYALTAAADGEEVEVMTHPPVAEVVSP